MKVTYQPETDSFYFYLKENVEHGRTEEIAPETMVDFDKAGNVIGIEIYSGARGRVDLNSFEAERYPDSTGPAASWKAGIGFLTELSTAELGKER